MGWGRRGGEVERPTPKESRDGAGVGRVGQQVQKPCRAD